MEEITEKNITVNPSDILVITYELDVIPLDTVYKHCKLLKERYPERKMICLPKGMDIEPSKWQSVYELIMSIKPQN